MLANFPFQAGNTLLPDRIQSVINSIRCLFAPNNQSDHFNIPNNDALPNAVRPGKQPLFVRSTVPTSAKNNKVGTRRIIVYLSTAGAKPEQLKIISMPADGAMRASIAKI